MKAVDCHCHLEFERFDGDRKNVIENARENLEFLVSAGSNLEQNRAVMKLADQNPEFIIPNLGLHPTYTEDFNETTDIKDQIRSEKPVAVGEIGLDHHHVTGKNKRSRQEEVFREMLQIAEEIQKPVVVHSREAESKAIEILKQYDLPDIMLHCFNGKPELAAEATSNDMKIGVTTQILYSSRVRKIAEKIEIKDILLETDSPFLYRDGRNEPANVLESGEKLAELKEIEMKNVIETTTRNARTVFGQEQPS